LSCVDDVNDEVPITPRLTLWTFDFIDA
jgi:hypothetical protein